MVLKLEDCEGKFAGWNRGRDGSFKFVEREEEPVARIAGRLAEFAMVVWRESMFRGAASGEVGWCW